MHLLYVLGVLVIPCIAKPLPEASKELPKRNVQFRFQPDRAAAVKEAFQFAWNGYYTYAFPADELNPITRGKGYSRNGWGATAIDALSTAIIMELPDIVNTIVDYVPTIDYTHTNNQSSEIVSVFETTIRYLGGMLAGYDLLDGPFSNLLANSSKIESLLAQSKVLADTLSFAFNTTSGIPDNNVAFNSMTRSGQNTGLAVVGSLVLEWTRLSDLTGDPKYAQLTQRAEEYLLRPQFQPPFSEPFPGMLGSEIDLNTGKFLDASGGWVGGSDSFYEYLIKMFAYDALRFGEYRDRWIAAADSSIKYLGSHPSSRPDLTFMAQYEGKTPIYSSEHLACFDGGNFILGGMTLGEQKYIDFGLALTAGCHNTYISTATHIGPETFAWLPAECAVAPLSNDTAPPKVPIRKRKLNAAANSPYLPDPYPSPTAVPQCTEHCDFYQDAAPIASPTATSADSAAPAATSNPACAALPQASSAFYAQNGFYVTNGYYDLRPETLESYYYAYRITGDPKYQEWAWDAFVAINATARVGAGFSSFRSVDTVGGGGYGNNQESFFFAEVMKYAYMIFAEDGVWQVNHRGNGKDRFVFNTEAHPVRVVFPPL